MKKAIILSIYLMLILVVIAIAVSIHNGPLQSQIRRSSREAVIPIIGFLKLDMGTYGLADHADYKVFIYDLPWHDDPNPAFNGLSYTLKAKPLTTVIVGLSSKSDIRCDTAIYTRSAMGDLDPGYALPLIMFDPPEFDRNPTREYPGSLFIVIETDKQRDQIVKSEPGTLFLPSWIRNEHWLKVHDKIVSQAQAKDVVYLDLD